MEPLIIALAEKYPLVVSLFAVMGIFRAVFKPIMSLARAYVKATEKNEKDDLFLDEVEQSKWFKILSWLVDYTASIKLDPKK